MKSPEGNPHIVPENQYHGDPSLPFFHFSKEEKAKKVKELMNQGWTEESATTQVLLEESAIINRFVQAKQEKESEEGK